ncbi:MAG TPA: hypothetical protein VK841_05330 [Polyangiaceae bacterium]|jgi:hypothetical protein|nr:hypothetical protein [Polyangiaceae bacterium]
MGEATGPRGDSIPAPKPTMPPPLEKRSLSGHHPAVTAYRNKLESIVEGVEERGAGLDAELAEYLEKLRTPVPPAPDDD